MYAIVIADTGETFSCAPGQSVLAALERSGRRAIAVGCRGGGCGVCRVEVVGTRAYRTLKMSRAQVTGADADAGIALACKLIPEGDLIVRPLGPRSGTSQRPATYSPQGPEQED